METWISHCLLCIHTTVWKMHWKHSYWYIQMAYSTIHIGYCRLHVEWTNTIKKFRCYEAKQKVKRPAVAGSLKPWHLWLKLPVLCHWATTTGQPPTVKILYVYCSGGTESLSLTPGSHLAVLEVLNASVAHWTIFRSTPNRVLMAGCQVWDWGIQYHLSSTHRGLWQLVVVQLSWLSGRALAAQARDVLALTPADCRPSLFCLTTSKSLFPAWSKMPWANIYHNYSNHDWLYPM